MPPRPRFRGLPAVAGADSTSSPASPGSSALARVPSDIAASGDTLCTLPATRLRALLDSREISARELVEAHLRHIEAVNPAINAIVTLVPELALQRADAADAAMARGGPVGPLHGLPVVHKDLALTRGVRTTFGSPVFADNIPDRDSLIVERLAAAGAIMLGKSNTPEFGAGSQTFNPVFGATVNPWDHDRTCGGSSGGAAAALAAAMVPIADGSDLGGSLRNPAAFCGVVGLRPSPGRVPTWPTDAPWNPLPVEGPMARNVGDCALMLSAMAGPDPRSPIALSEPGNAFAGPLERDWRGTRVAWSPDFGGALPVDPAIVTAIEACRPDFDAIGLELEPALPDFSDADECFITGRAWLYAQMGEALLQQHRARMKDTLVWNIEAGLALTGSQIAAAERRHAALYHRLRAFFEHYDFLVLPVTQVLPFPVEQEWVREINGEAMHTYLDWMRSCYWITVTGHPAISVPCGFSAEGLPVGLQIVGRHRDDLAVLQLARAFEQASGHGWRAPPLPGGN